jgi:Cache domain
MTTESFLSPRRYKIEWALLGIALLILGTSISYWLLKEHAEIDARERDRLQSQAQVIDENLGHQLKGMNDALMGVVSEFSISSIKKSSQEATRHLRALSGAMPGVRSMFVLDAEGKLLAATWENFVPGQDFSHREYYKTPHEQPDPAALYISTPFTTNEGIFSLNVSRVAVGPNGEFSGLVTATLEPDYFNVVLRSVLYAPDMATFIAHADGRVFVVTPENAEMLGKDLSMPGSNFSQYQERGQTAAVMTGIVYATGEQRLRALRTVQLAELKIDKPLVIAVGRNIAAVFASWRSEAFANGGFFGLFAMTVCIGLYLSQKRRDSNYSAMIHADQALRQQNALLTRQKEELETTLSRVKRLEGMISICIYCKNIRTETNVWQKLEQYIGENADAVFSHGVCPECLDQQTTRLK